MLIGSFFSIFIKWVTFKISGWILVVLGIIQSILIIFLVIVWVEIVDWGTLGLSIWRAIWVGIGLMDGLIV
jgi:hypothetical protein